MSSSERTFTDIKDVTFDQREMQIYTLTDDGKVAKRTVTEISFADVDTPEILIADAVAANTEVAFVLPDGIKKLKIRARTIVKMRIAWTATETKNNGKYLSVGQGGVYSNEGIKTKGNTIYLRTNKSNIKIEIECWK